ncbi:small integral membrane protein 29 isoform X2 [Nothobranchius furzeri]|nr:small integral membrane protein 29 isoform X2 [Nothobranchius furzeri]XP_054588897.1 small integral membrane protein 29 isoform X2 [Nothobranchius furzeri]
MNFNYTTAFTSTPHNKPEFPGYYALIPFFLLILIGCAVAVVVYIRRRSRMDELRHRLIPLYSYDPAEEQQEWGEAGGGNEEAEQEPLNRQAQPSFPSDYGT